jgi:two-component system cell cycle sensor histidine kinase/response regulator CckA
MSQILKPSSSSSSRHENLLSAIAVPHAGLEQLPFFEALSKQQLSLQSYVSGILYAVQGSGRGADGERTMVDVARVVHEIESIAKSTFPKNITFERTIADNLCEIPADATQLHQVLLNLCVNARDAMPDGGRLRIVVENLTINKRCATMFAEAHPGRYIVIEVSDEGCGMDAATKERVFEPFFTTKTFGEGTGLGLPTVMGIVRGHGGFINVYSELGVGTRFNIYLPVEIKKLAAVQEIFDDSDPVLPHGNGERILVVDDEAAIRTLSKLTLEAYGYEVITAENGVEAKRIFAERKDEISLLISDITMPEMDGIALIGEVKKNAPDLPVIGISGLRANGNKIRAQEIGVTGFLPKPFTAEALLRAVHAVLHQLA